MRTQYINCTICRGVGPSELARQRGLRAAPRLCFLQAVLRGCKAADCLETDERKPAALAGDFVVDHTSVVLYQNASTSLTSLRSTMRPRYDSEPALTGRRLYPRFAKKPKSCAHPLPAHQHTDGSASRARARGEASAERGERGGASDARRRSSQTAPSPAASAYGGALLDRRPGTARRCVHRALCAWERPSVVLTAEFKARIIRNCAALISDTPTPVVPLAAAAAPAAALVPLAAAAARAPPLVPTGPARAAVALSAPLAAAAAAAPPPSSGSIAAAAAPLVRCPVPVPVPVPAAAAAAAAATVAIPAAARMLVKVGVATRAALPHEGARCLPSPTARRLTAVAVLAVCQGAAGKRTRSWRRP
jgi:hypothetical protein